mgnify:FL=1
MLLDRTFHPDEANQAFTTGRLLETGTYRYDPKDHHGPTLYYAAAAIQKAAGNSSTATLDATLLRCTPLFFAAITVLLGFSTVRRIARNASVGIAFAALLATAPMFVFFATDFIQEMLLACFTMMMFWAGTGYFIPHTSAEAKARRGKWALLFGIAAGLAFSTKETSVLSFAAASIAALPFLPKWRRHCAPDAIGGLNASSHAVLALLGFLLTSAIMYSSFTENWHGVYDAFVSAPLSYIHRAVGDASSEGAAAHIHPWWQYLKWIFLGNAVKDGPMHWTCRFSEVGILTQIFLIQLPVAAVCFALKKRTSPSIRNGYLYICAYTAVLFALYSAIPYKTPWCSLQMLTGLVVALSLGYALIADILTKAYPNAQNVKLAAALIPLSLSASIIFGDHLPGMRKMVADPDSREIPYNYAAASPQVKDMAAAISDAIRSQTNGIPFVAVAVPAEDTWPLPFYLRAINGKVGYWTKFEELEALADMGGRPDVVVVPAAEGHLVQPLFPHLRNTKRFEMRPHVRIRAFW